MSEAFEGMMRGAFEWKYCSWMMMGCRGMSVVVSIGSGHRAFPDINFGKRRGVASLDPPCPIQLAGD